MERHQRERRLMADSYFSKGRKALNNYYVVGGTLSPWPHSALSISCTSTSRDSRRLAKPSWTTLKPTTPLGFLGSFLCPSSQRCSDTSMEHFQSLAANALGKIACPTLLSGRLLCSLRLWGRSLKLHPRQQNSRNLGNITTRAAGELGTRLPRDGK
jgi:hypothetical protein